MEPIEFITPNKYKVYIKPRLNFGEYNQVRASVKKQMMIEVDAGINPDNPKSSKLKDLKLQPISLDALTSTNNVAMRLLVTKVLDANGIDLGDPADAINNLPIEDGDAVAAKIDEITAEAEVSKKKGI